MEMHLIQNQVSRSVRDSAHTAVSESSYACSGLIETSGGCSATGSSNEFKLLLCLVFLVATPGPSLGSFGYSKNEEVIASKSLMG